MGTVSLKELYSMDETQQSLLVSHHEHLKFWATNNVTSDWYKLHEA